MKNRNLTQKKAKGRIVNNQQYTANKNFRKGSRSNSTNFKKVVSNNATNRNERIKSLIEVSKNATEFKKVKISEKGVRNSSSNFQNYIGNVMKWLQAVIITLFLFYQVNGVISIIRTKMLMIISLLRICFRDKATGNEILEFLFVKFLSNIKQFNTKKDGSIRFNFLDSYVKDSIKNPSKVLNEYLIVALVGLIIFIINKLIFVNLPIYAPMAIVNTCIGVYKFSYREWTYRKLENNKSHEISKRYFKDGYDKHLLREEASKIFTPIKEKEITHYKFYIPIVSILLDIISVITLCIFIDKTGSYTNLLTIILSVVVLFIFNLLCSYRTAYLIHNELNMKVKRQYW